jgi:hypothetical protein
LTRAIHYELAAMLQENVASYSDVNRFCGKAILGLNLKEASLPPKDDGLDEVNEALLLALPDELWPSVWSIAHRICVPKRSVSH